MIIFPAHPANSARLATFANDTIRSSDSARSTVFNAPHTFVTIPSNQDDSPYSSEVGSLSSDVVDSQAETELSFVMGTNGTNIQEANTDSGDNGNQKLQLMQLIQ